jgi:hypothetical protein
MKEPASHGDGRPLAANVEKESPISPNNATDPTSVQNLSSIPSDQGQSLPFHVGIADGGIEIDAKIKNEADLDKLIQILQTIKPLLRSIYGLQPVLLPILLMRPISEAMFSATQTETVGRLVCPMLACTKPRQFAGDAVRRAGYLHPLGVIPASCSRTAHTAPVSWPPRPCATPAW